MLTPMNIGILGGVVVLLLLLVKMRKDRAAPAKPASAPKDRRRSRRADRAEKEPKGRRARPGPASIEAAASQTAATVPPEAPTADETPVAPDAEAWVEDLAPDAPTAVQDAAVEVPDEPQPEDGGDAADDAEPVATEPVATEPVATEPVVAEPVPSWQDDQVITAPGWPMPGEMDGGWAVVDDATTVVSEPTVEAGTHEPAPAPESDPEPADGWGEQTDDATEPEVGASVADGAGWGAEEGFDPAAGWGDTSEEESTAATAETPEPDDNWTSEWTQENPAPEVVPAPDTTTETADEWTVVDGWDVEPGSEPVLTTPSQQSGEDEEWGNWPAETGDASVTHEAAGSEWDLATAEAAAAAAPEAPPAEASHFDDTFASSADDAFAAFDTAPAEAPRMGDRLAALFGAPAGENRVSDPAPARPEEVVAAGWADDMPVQEAAEALPAFDSVEPILVEPVPAGEPTFGTGDSVEPILAEPVPAEEPTFDTEDSVEPILAEPFAVEPLLVEEPSFDREDSAQPAGDDPLAQWAALSPATATTIVADDPVLRWAALTPPAPKPPVPADPAARWASITPIAPAASAPERDRQDVGELSGRFALGGFAVQEGHQVVTGVTFRHAADVTPSGWALGPCPDAAPGTLVIDLEGTLNCTEGDVEILGDPGFAPTTSGFTLRLTAPAAGPFAASGTYRLA
jgi:hypothetical protein